MYRVYISPSVQEKNIGYGDYGTEEKQMQAIGDIVGKLLKDNGNFIVFRNKPEWSLEKVVQDSNSLAIDLHVAIHSDAGPEKAEGTSVFYCQGSTKGEKFAKLLYDEIAPLSPGKDRGYKPDSELYASGLYELRKTKAPAALIEVAFHTNPVEAKWIMENHNTIAKGIYTSICKYFDVAYESKIDVAAIEQIIKKIESDLSDLKRLLNPVWRGDDMYRKEGLTHIIEVNPLDLYIEIPKLAGNKIKGDFVNGTFFGNYKGQFVSIGTLVKDGKVLAEQLAHDNVKRGTFIVYKDGSVAVEMIDFISKHPRLKDIHFAISGFNMFPLDLKAEWFNPKEVGYETWRTVIGYNPTKKKAIIAVRPNSTAVRGQITLKNLGCTCGIGLDSGGSTNARMAGKNIRTTTRVIHNIIRWK